MSEFPASILEKSRPCLKSKKWLEDFIEAIYSLLKVDFAVYIEIDPIKRRFIYRCSGDKSFCEIHAGKYNQIIPEIPNENSGISVKAYFDKKDNNEFDYICLPDVEDKKDPNHKYYKDLGIGVKSEISIPISTSFLDTDKFTISGILVLSSKQKNYFNNKQHPELFNKLKTIIAALTSSISWERLSIIEETWKKIYKDVSFSNKHKKFSDFYKNIFQILKALTPNQLKYIGIWFKYSDEKGHYLIKQNYEDYMVELERKEEHKICSVYSLITPTTDHEYRDFLEELERSKEKDGKYCFKKRLKTLRSAKLDDKQAFISNYRLLENDILLLTPILDPMNQDLRGIITWVVSRDFDPFMLSDNNMKLFSSLLFNSIEQIKKNKKRELKKKLYMVTKNMLNNQDFFGEKVLQIAKDVLNIEGCSIFLYDDLYKRLNLKYTTGIYRVGTCKCAKLKAIPSNEYQKISYTKDQDFSSKTWEAFDSKKIVICYSSNECIKHHPKTTEVAKIENCRSFMAALIEAPDGEKLGVIRCINKKSPFGDKAKDKEYFSDVDKDMLEHFSEMLGMRFQLIATYKKSISNERTLYHEISTQSLAAYNRIEWILKNTKQSDYIREKLIDVFTWNYNINFYTRVTNVFTLNAKDLEKEIVPLFGSIIIKWVNDLTREARKRAISFNLGEIHDLPRVFVNSNLMEMAIYNLLRNAVQYAIDGSTVEIEGVRINNFAVLKITNYGIPIYEEEKEKIFQIDYRTKEAKIVRSEGTGLGLPLVNQIVDELHGGMIDVESVEVAKKNTVLLQEIYRRFAHDSEKLQELVDKEDIEMLNILNVSRGRDVPRMTEAFADWFVKNKEYIIENKDDFDYYLNKPTYKTTFSMHIPVR